VLKQVVRCSESRPYGRTKKDAYAVTQDQNNANSKTLEKGAGLKSSATKTAKVSKPADRATASKTKPAGQAKQGLLWLLVLILIAAVAGLGYLQWQTQSFTAQLTSGQSGQSKALENWQQKQQSLSQKLDDATLANAAALSNIKTEQTDIKNNQQAMDDALVVALEAMAKAQLDQGQVLPKWQLAEAEYLLRLANQRLAMEQASESAIALLSAADIIIRDSEQVGTYGIRRAIALDLASLTAVPSVDVQGVYAQLAALSSLASKLTFIPPRSEAVAVEAVQSTQDSTLPVSSAQGVTWSESLWLGTKSASAGIFSELKQLVKVQSRTQEDQQLLTPAAQLLVRMRIEMALSQTQVALLRRQQGIYDQSLEGVQQLLTQYYRPSDAVVKAMNKTIDELSEVKVLVNMPNISGSLVALQGFIATLHDTPAQPLVGE
jgi:uroporphyrin-3 C-methyltransferase|tara:strand:+ start:251 stop:1552 length:1302 start_codon:yes stop_codon:yes gene_type:complete